MGLQWEQGLRILSLFPPLQIFTLQWAPTFLAQSRSFCKKIEIGASFIPIPWIQKDGKGFGAFNAMGRHGPLLQMKGSERTRYLDGAFRVVKKTFAFAGALFIFLVVTKSAWALVYVEVEGSYLYFPKSEERIGSRLAEHLPDMLSFLSNWGLSIKPGFHIVLDEDLDLPEVEVHVTPHREIRIPLRAPGVLEDGYTEKDPWSYFLFKGLCLQAIYGIRSGIPGFLYRGFGEIMSPNVIIPPWLEDGICNLLYAHYGQREIQDPMEAAVFQTSPPPDLEIISNHPQIWPGHNGYRIYGKPFLSWLYQEYGWNKIFEFLEVHGEGIIPIEVDFKAREVFGKTGIALWDDFQKAYGRKPRGPEGLLITGYWGKPFVYWNRSGVYPGKTQVRRRGRYGAAELDGTLWVSQYEGGASRIYKYTKGTALPVGMKHVWDPAPGGVAVTRKGSVPHLILFPDDGKGGFRRSRKSDLTQATWVKGPTGVIQMSGPVQNDQGRIAVAANLEGNWDIWIYDGQWRRLTKTPSIELDPWWENGTLVYASNLSGRFQIHGAGCAQITHAEHVALLPRQGTYLDLHEKGWRLETYQIDRAASTPQGEPIDRDHDTTGETPDLETKPYTPLKSIWPNYIRPDAFAAVTDFQIGLATKGRDVTGKYLLDGGLRYSFDTDFFALRAALQVLDLGFQFTRYPLSYDTNLVQQVDEARNEVKVFWRLFETEDAMRTEAPRMAEGIRFYEGLELSANWRNYEPLEGEGETEDETWASLVFTKRFGIFRGWGNFEVFSEDRQALSGGFRLLFGDKVFTLIHMMGGRTWGDPVLGHNTFRIGGNVPEGYFTRRPSRLFPLRGFDSNLLEASKAATAGIEVFWPLANLQAGYETFPLFLHRLRLGTFIDAGIAGESLSREDIFVGAGVELVTSMEIAWGNFSELRIGVAWPLRQPDYLDEDGPVFVFQLGRPL